MHLLPFPYDYEALMGPCAWLWWHMERLAWIWGLLCLYLTTSSLLTVLTPDHPTSLASCVPHNSKGLSWTPTCWVLNRIQNHSCASWGNWNWDARLPTSGQRAHDISNTCLCLHSLVWAVPKRFLHGVLTISPYHGLLFGGQPLCATHLHREPKPRNLRERNICI